MNKKIPIWKLILDSLLTLLYIGTFYITIRIDEPIWHMPFQLTNIGLWILVIYHSFISLFDWLSFLNIQIDRKYEFFMRNVYLRIGMTFSLGIVFIYWLMVLLDMVPFSSNPTVILWNCYMNGLACLLSFGDVLFGEHQFIPNYFIDILVIIGLNFFYWSLIFLSRYIIEYEPYDFIKKSSPRRLLGIGILMDMLFVNTYGIYQLIGFYCFKGEKSQYSNEINLTETSDDKKINYQMTGELINNDTSPPHVLS